MRPVLLLLLGGIISSSGLYANGEHGYQEALRSDGSKAESGGDVTSQGDDVGEPLFLTPLIESGKYQEALHKSRVGKIGSIPNVLSYSGFITVNKDLGSNLFFWFFPAMALACWNCGDAHRWHCKTRSRRKIAGVDRQARPALHSFLFLIFSSQESPENAPVSLWLQGGPGTSSLFGLFVEHGPYFVDENGVGQLRPITWTRTISVLYVDNPVGTGFSFTQNERGYARNQSDVSRDMIEMLQQFFTLFSNYSSNDFYLSGESYAGECWFEKGRKYIPSIGAALHKSKGKLRVPINLKGIAIGNGMIDPITMLLYGDFLYDIGLLDRYQASRMQQDCDRIAGLIREENYLEAAALAYSTVLGVVTGYPSYLGNVTGYKYGYNYLLTEKPESHSRYTSFVKTPMVRQAIHVGSTPFNKAALNVAVYFTKDLMHSVRDNLTLLLDNSYKVKVPTNKNFRKSVRPLSYDEVNNENTCFYNLNFFRFSLRLLSPLLLFHFFFFFAYSHKVLIYSGPLDIIVSYPATEALMYSLKWSGSKEWSKAEKKIWRSNDGECVYGYSKHARNCRLVLVRNGGHIVPYDQPEAAYEMITKFFNNVPFVK
ncbi:probable serine carboxypeptidase CPVL [Dermacentor andersoni]|uniref:probable serine carboxypeptidase CPVL n=1 Tax=Dermacentor andersoni TaxID=34620 RepID=UPI003B3A3191